MADFELTKLRRARSRCHLQLKQARRWRIRRSASELGYEPPPISAYRPDTQRVAPLTNIPVDRAADQAALGLRLIGRVLPSGSGGKLGGFDGGCCPGARKHAIASAARDSV